MYPISGLADLVRLRTWQLCAGSHTEEWPLTWIAALDPERPQRPLPKQEQHEPELPASLTVGQSVQEIPSQPPSSTSNKPAGRSPLQCMQWAIVHAERIAPKQEAAAHITPIPPLGEQDYAALRPGVAPRVLLAPPTRWWPALRAFAPERRLGLDVEATVGLLARGHLPLQLPQRQTAGMYRHLQIWRNADKAMVPYFADFDAVAHELRRRPIAMCTTEHRFQGSIEPSVTTGDALLILSDLGANGAQPQSEALAWSKTLRTLLRRGVHVAVWAPSSAARIATVLARTAAVTPFHEGSRFRPCAGVQVQDAAPGSPPAWQREAQDRLLPLLAVTQRVEPALLRRLRRLAGGQGKPEWEQALWQHCVHAAGGENVLQMLSKSRPHWRTVFAQLGTWLQLAQWHAMAGQHAYLPRSTLFSEQLLWGNYARPEARQMVAGQLVLVNDWFARLAEQERVNSQTHSALAQAGLPHAMHPDFVRDFLLRNADDTNFGQQQAPLVARLGIAAGMPGHNVGVPNAQWLKALPGAGEVSASPWSVDWQNRGEDALFFKNPFSKGLPKAGPNRSVLQVGHWGVATWQPRLGALQFLSDAMPHWPTEAGTLTVNSSLGVQEFYIDTLHRQPWQHALGRDRYGVFCEVLVKSQTLCLRYIPPGTFLMGSPEGTGHEYEHPQHPVTIAQGFWLANTPCTQALWESVMGSNPSHFSDDADAPQRPVEEVSFDDVDAFFEKLRSLLPEGCTPEVSTEAEWEYATRAGTTTAYWWGDDADSSRANWGGEQKGTTPVKRYPANPWGLYDVHGNVWEWCADPWRERLDAPDGAMDDDSRVVRGGSWFGGPGIARAAMRHGGLRDFRSRYLGFRLVLRFSSQEGTPVPKGLGVNFVTGRTPLGSGSAVSSENATTQKRS